MLKKSQKVKLYGVFYNQVSPKTIRFSNSPAGTRRCDNAGFLLSFGRDVGQRRSNVVTTLSFQKSNVVAMLCFRRRFSEQILTL